MEAPCDMLLTLPGSHTTLEEVFLRLAADEHAEAGRQSSARRLLQQQQQQQNGQQGIAPS